MSKVAVIGAGAAGIIAALKASNKNEVILIDGNNKCGKKLLVTGNGKCNYWNEEVGVQKYYASDFKLLENILKKDKETLDFLSAIGIYPKIKNGYFYPASGTAQSIREIFEKEIERNKIKTLYNTRVKDIEKDNEKFIIITDNEKISVDKIIIATGSKACPKTGSDGFGYYIAKKFGHKINPVLPALTSLKTNDNIKDWAGIRTEVKLNLYINNKLIKEEGGEIQLTEEGISGICTFNLSGLVTRAVYDQEDVKIKINFFPYIDNFYDFFNERNDKIKNRTIEELLESLLNYKLTAIILKKSQIQKNCYWHELNEDKKKLLCKNIESFEIIINDYNSYDKAQVCTGGIPLDEINANMESIYVPNLYFVGEILDVDGKCGGFNLAFAFITGYIVGLGV